jgi:glycosyltransferase 2 family protein
MKKLIVTLFKVGISVGIIAYLIWDSTHSADKVNVFENLRDQPKNWWMLAGAFTFIAAAVMLTFIRWWYLVRALEIPCRFPDAIRISFWGFLFNLAPLGIVGGDLVKAVMLAHEHPQYRAKAVASVLFDRVVGLYILFVVASSAIVFTGFWRISVPEVSVICQATLLITAIGTAGIFFLYIPGIMDGPLVRALGRLPYGGQMIHSLIEAIGLYRYMPKVLIASSILSLGVHCSLVVGVFLIARGLPGDVLSLGTHFVVWPISGAAGVLPLPFGPTEFLLDFLYRQVPAAGITIPKGHGLLVVLCYRLITVLIAALGIFYYFTNRREVSEAIHETEQPVEV